MRDEDASVAPRASSTSDAREVSGEEVEPKEAELTAHEYARECGLCTDYLTESPFDVLVKWQTPREDLEDPDDASYHGVTADKLARERLDIGLDARKLLFSIVHDDPDSFLHTPPDFERAPNDLKLEMPLLQTGDHEVDVLHFGHRPSPDFANMNLPMEHTECEKDEGLEWPTRYHDLPQRTGRKYAAEKLEFPRKGVEFLMGIMKDEWSAVDMDELLDSEITYTKVRYELLRI